MPRVRDTIEPTELEQRIFKTLKAAAADGGTPVTLRCAGGWVRDKLLGLDTDSPDIDVALDTLTGAAFGQALQRHLQESHDEVARAVVIESNPEQSKHLETARIRVGLCILELSGIVSTMLEVLRSILDSSTACIRQPAPRMTHAAAAATQMQLVRETHLNWKRGLQVHGVSLDLVNLRSETYTQDSRIPGAIQFGTPEQVRAHTIRGALLASRRITACAAA